MAETNTANANTIRIYRDLDEAMNKLHDQGDDEGRKEAEEIADMLLSYADLPLKIRCRALMIKALSDAPGYVEYAKEAVRYAELGMTLLTSPASEGTKQLLADCKQVLKEAEEAYAEHGYDYDEESAAQGGEGGDVKMGGEDEEGEVVWDSTWTDEQKAAQLAKENAENTGITVQETGEEEKTGEEEIWMEPPKIAVSNKKSRRLDSSRAMVMEYDEERDDWFDVGEVGSNGAELEGEDIVRYS